MGRKRHKKKRMNIRKLIIQIILLVCVCVILVSAWQLFQIMKNYKDSNDLYDTLIDKFVQTRKEEVLPDGGEGTIFTESDTEVTDYYSQVPWSLQQYVDLDGLRANNPDTAGWLSFEDGSISYPVMYSGDNSRYLHTSYDGTYAYAGALFLEGANHPDFQDSHTIIYGHNMRNLSMFGRLKYYYLDPNYYQDHQYFQLFTGEKVYRYHIFAYEQVRDDSFIYQVPFADCPEFQEFLDDINLISTISFGPEIETSDHIITLSTCTQGNGRFVVHAVRCAEAVYD